jgi:Zn-dependent protease
LQDYPTQPRLLATRICVRWQFFIALPAFWLVTRSALGGMVALISLVVLLVVHELGHVAFARFCGLRVERIELHLLQGWCIYSEPEYEVETIIVAWGGVLVQLALLLICALVYHSGYLSPAVLHLLYPVFAVFIAWNALSLAVNLLPIEGWDGHTAWRIVPAIRDGTLLKYLRARRAASGLTQRVRQ